MDYLYDKINTFDIEVLIYFIHFELQAEIKVEILLQMHEIIITNYSSK